MNREPWYDDLAQSWSELTQSLQVAPGAAADTFADLCRRYREPSRHYHTLEHIHEMLTMMRALPNPFPSDSAVPLAIWFHDAVYDSRRRDNEDRSASLATDHMARWGIADQFGGRVEQMVRATSHSGDEPDDPADRLVCDVDLAILGASPERYDRYSADIRREYDWVDDADYRVGRGEVLKPFLERSVIYMTTVLAPLDGAARANMTRELERLRTHENTP